MVTSDLSENSLGIKTGSCVDAVGRASRLTAVVVFVGMINHAVLIVTHPPCVPVGCAPIIQAAQDD